MNDHRERVASVTTETRQSPGSVPTSTDCDGSPANVPQQACVNPKRNSGIFSFLKWFRSASKESVASSRESPTSSLGSIRLGGSNCSLNSTGTAASFNFIPPAAYTPKTSDRCIQPGPETDTYKARLKQRDKVREKDRNITLRQKYNLLFGRDKSVREVENKQLPTSHIEDNCQSLPLMTKTKENDKCHRRTNSDSSKGRQAGAYLHVKGKRKAPPPPKNEKGNSLSLRRKKRLAPPPPVVQIPNELAQPFLKPIETNSTNMNPSTANGDVLQNDCLKLDHGVLKSTKENKPTGTPSKSEIPVSPKPWYKRQGKVKQKCESGSSDNNVKVEKSDKSEDKRKSNIMFLTNISELDREASEIIRNQINKQPNTDYELPEIPEFMKPKMPEAVVQTKRKSAKDLIAKFNAITGVTKVTANSALFTSNEKSYFGKRKDSKEKITKEVKKELKENGIIPQQSTGSYIPLMKSETTSCVMVPPKEKSVTPKLEKLERKKWICPKCNLENEYWRIICHVCSTIKPYFDNFTAADSPVNKHSSSSSSSSSNNVSLLEDLPTISKPEVKTNPVIYEPPTLLRSKTQIGFIGKKDLKMATASCAQAQNVTTATKREDKEKLKKMLIEMKNSLPKRRSHVVPTNRKSTIDESLEVQDHPEEQQNKENKVLENEANLDIRDEKLLEVDKKSVQKELEVQKIKPVLPNLPQSSNETKAECPYQLLGSKDFETIYSGKVGMIQPTYANLPKSQKCQPEEVFFNVPKKLNELKHTLGCNFDIPNNSGPVDTLEINKLLRRLESAIAKGDINDAAGYAKDLAQLKINCSVIRQRPSVNSVENNNKFTVDMFVEDRLSHRGPFPIDVYDSQTVLELKEQVHKLFDIPLEVQRMILGNELASKDDVTLKEHNVTKGSPIFLYLVAPTPGTPKKLGNESKQDLLSGETKEINSSQLPKYQASTSTNLDLPKVKNTKIDIVKSPNLSRITSGFVRSEKSAFAVVTPEKEKLLTREDIETDSPRIVGEHLKVHVMIKPTSNAETQVGEIKVGPVSKLPVKKTSVTSKNMATPSITTNSSVNSSGKISTDLVTAVKTSVVVQTAPGPSTTASTSTSTSKVTVIEVKSPPKAEPEDFSEYDKTLNAKVLKTASSDRKDSWICHMCTLVNNATANICSVCAAVRQKNVSENGPTKLHYYELMHLDNSDLVPNSETFECLICLTEVQPKTGVTLRECLHQFCKACLAHTIEFCEDAEVKCPYRDATYSCDTALQDREIKALVTRQKYEQFLARSVKQAENKMDKTFHCKTPDCTGWCVYEDNVNDFRCPICKKTNCLNCQAIHLGLNCRQYQEHLNSQSQSDEDGRQTREWLLEMVEKGEALECPACHVVMIKKWGCDWVRCSMCKTEICWATRGLRWGPAGKGDTSGGCKCGVNGVKCHAKCNYCH